MSRILAGRVISEIVGIERHAAVAEAPEHCVTNAEVMVNARVGLVEDGHAVDAGAR